VPPFGPRTPEEAVDMKIREPGGRNLQIYENSSDGTTERERREGDKERDVRGGHTNREIRGAGMARDEKPPSPLLGSEGNARGKFYLGQLPFISCLLSYSPFYDDVVRPRTETWVPHLVRSGTIPWISWNLFVFYLLTRRHLSLSREQNEGTETWGKIETDLRQKMKHVCIYDES
jgi:hypothetical protein